MSERSIVEKRLVQTTRLRTVIGVVTGMVIIGVVVLVLSLVSGKPSLNPGTSRFLFSVTDSGATKEPGWTIAVNADGSGTKITRVVNERGGETSERRFAAGTFRVSDLARELDSYGDVSTLGSAECLKSASFGHTETINYHDRTSSDLLCPSGEKSADELVQQLLSVIQPAGSGGL